jgi:TPR repeat protein
MTALFLSACSPAPEPMQTIRDHYFYGGLAAFHEDLPDEAARQWLRAAELGDGEAARNLGHLYRNGLGVEADGHMAQAWYQVAADAGVVSAEYNLGMLYLKGGPGLEPDPAKGEAFLTRAAAKGFIPARVEMDRLAVAASPSPPPPPPAAEPAPAPPPPEPVRVQLGSYPTRTLAEQDWKRLHPYGLTPEIVVNRVGGKRWHRLLAVGPAEAVDAFCAAAPSRGVACRPVGH